MQDVIGALSPEQLAAMSKAAGMPPGMELSPEMAKAAAASLAKLSPEELESMSKAAAGMPRPAAFGGGAASSSSSSAALAAAGGMPGGMPAVDPRQAADMLSAMGPEQMVAMSKMMPEGLNMSPEMLKVHPGGGEGGRGACVCMRRLFVWDGGQVHVHICVGGTRMWPAFV